MMNNHQEPSFLPNFCATKPFLSLILFAELLAISVVLLRTPFEMLNWLSFALTSFYIQWIVLLSGLGMCVLRRYFGGLSAIQLGVWGYIVILSAVLMVSSVAQWILFKATRPDELYQWQLVSILQPLAIAVIVAGMVMRYWFLQWVKAQSTVGMDASLGGAAGAYSPPLSF